METETYTTSDGDKFKFRVTYIKATGKRHIQLTWKLTKEQKARNEVQRKAKKQRHITDLMDAAGSNDASATHASAPDACKPW